MTSYYRYKLNGRDGLSRALDSLLVVSAALSCVRYDAFRADTRLCLLIERFPIILHLDGPN